MAPDEPESVPRRRLQEQHRRDALGISEAQELIADPGETGHESGSLYVRGRTTQPAALLDRIHDARRAAQGVVEPARLAEDAAGQHERIEVAEGAVAQRVIARAAIAQGRVQGDVDIRTDSRIVVLCE